MTSQRRRNRNHQSLMSLARLQPNNASLRIYVGPLEHRQIAKTLSSVKPKPNKASPFGRGPFQDRAQFKDRKWASLNAWKLLAQRDYRRCRIFVQIPVIFGRSKDRPHYP